MMHEIEELMKGVNRSAIKAMLRHATIINDPMSSEKVKAQALENVRAIAHSGKLALDTSAPKKVKAIKPVVAPAAESAQPAQQPVQVPPATQSPQIQQPAGVTVPPKIEYPQGLHLSPINTVGHDEAAMKGIFDALPDHEKQHVAEWHSKNKMVKSIDTLYSLFTQLKKHL